MELKITKHMESLPDGVYRTITFRATAGEGEMDAAKNISSGEADEVEEHR
jgi:hypothetical protein